MEIWINPACSKCRAALSAFDEAGLSYTVRRYLDDPPTAAELEVVLDHLGLQPWDLARPNESKDAANGVAGLPRDDANRGAWIDAMVAHPILIQRPIVTADDGTATIARDPEVLRAVLAKATRS
ncbi:MAG TPA: ArsC/Spx/MgsR family protein [Mycobacteriales bacterium]|jgi:arsenate reductase|nr:ArsC/Spx/MgsR family protein [Mycobacteriales bacterium]